MLCHLARVMQFLKNEDGQTRASFVVQAGKPGEVKG